MDQTYDDTKNFFNELKEDVNSFLKEKNIPKKQSRASLLNAFFLFSLWSLFFTLYLTLGQLHPAWALAFSFLWATVMLAIQMSVMHDASHGASSDSSTTNDLLSFSISFLGGSAILWKKQHCQAHHSFTNVHNLDHDIDTGGILRLHHSQPLKSHHKWQHYYAWLLYPLFVLSWIWWGDLRDIIYNTYSMTKTQINSAIIENIIIKVWHVLIFLALPTFMLGSFWLALSCYLFSFSLLGFVMVVIFQLAHISGTQSLPDTVEELGNDWAIRQILTTANFATENSFLTWFIGGLNYQVEHHIFPKISHVNYPIISKIVQKKCKQANIEYQTFPSVMNAIVHHQRHLIKFGQLNKPSTL